jgi:hypothetical protein
MSYIGNQVTSVPFTADVFSGTGSATRFGPMIRTPATVAAVAVYVNGLYRTPGVDYTLDVDFIVFTSPPALGTNNIVAHHLGNGVMATQVPVDGSVTTPKIAVGAVLPNNFSSSANSKIFSSGVVSSIIFGG